MPTSAKRILFLVGATNVYGAEIAMLNVMRGLKKRCYEVHCIASGWSDGDFASRLQSEGISFSKLKLGFIYATKFLWTLDTLWHYPGALSGFFRIRKSFKPDYVYHLSCRTIIMLYPFISKRNTIHHVEDVIPKTIMNSIFYGLAEKKVSKFIAASDQVRKSLVSLNVPDARIAVVLNGVSNSPQHDVPVEGRFTHRFTIGIVGQVIERKGHVVLIEALNILKQQKYDFECLIIGSGNDRYIEKVRRLIEERGLAENVRWIDYLEDQSTIYQDLDVLAVPSYDDACPLVALEASLRGIPTIASRVGGLPEIVQDGVTGFLFEAGNCKELAERILLLMDDEELRRRIGAAARAYGREDLTEDVMCTKVEGVLRSIEGF